MTIYLPELQADNIDFPSPHQALNEPNGLLAFGGDLRPQRLLAAYHKGIFPWYSEGEPILWWSPAPRAIFNPATFSPAKSLKKFFRKSDYRISINKATHDVIRLCAETRGIEQTWITHDMQTAYQTLANLNHCHSVEVWQNDQLVGGLYGVQVGGIFCGESMFSLATNASKIALWHFCIHFSSHGGQLIDCQVMNDHLASLGAIELERDEFLQKLQQYQQHTLNSHCYLPQWLS